MKAFRQTFLALSLIGSCAAQAETAIETVTVTADFRPSELQQTPVSATVFTADIIAQQHAQHLEQLLAMAANVNFAGGSSRARYFQIRGIGERSQFKEPINPSVGLIIDDVDFTGIGTAGSLFDMQQVEILRGPQGTRYGANALAGIVAMQSQQPTEKLEAYVESTIANYDTYALGAALGGPINEQWQYRLAIQKNESDGYIDNVYLNREDTNNFDELTARAKLRWLASDSLTIDSSVFVADVDNGYDAFNFDNSRNSIADQPGHDKQKTDALAIKADWIISSALNSNVIVSYSDSELEYGYDEDWSYVGLCNGTACEGWEYSSIDNYQRERDAATVELRLLSGDTGRIFNDSTNWLLGVYYKDQSENLDRQYTYLTANFFSDFDTKNTALFAETITEFTGQLSLTAGLRVEDWQADYQDSDELAIATDETLYGGKLVLDYRYTDVAMIYASIARGYKAGGVNTDGSLSASDRDFDTEYQWAYEVGVKHSSLNQRLQTRLAIFYTQRKDQQVKGSVLVQRSDMSTEFIDYIANAAAANNYGVELEGVYQATEQLQFSASVGWLETEFKDYIADSGDDMSGRDQAHAPNYQYSLSVRYDINELFTMQLAAEGKDAFYFSDRHNAQSSSYDVINASIRYAVEQWSLSLWAKNLSDEEYAVRGFGSFGNNPQNFYATETYTQLGEPRTLGVTARYNF